MPADGVGMDRYRSCGNVKAPLIDPASHLSQGYATLNGDSHACFINIDHLIHSLHVKNYASSWLSRWNTGHSSFPSYGNQRCASLVCQLNQLDNLLYRSGSHHNTLSLPRGKG